MRSKPSGRWLVKSLRCARGREFGLAAAAVGGPLVALLVAPLGAAALEPAPGVTLEAGVIADSYANVRGGADPDGSFHTLGAGVASARLCRQLSWLEGLTGETAWELFYRAQVTPWLAVQPDLQYFVHPGGGGKDNALAAGLRVEMSL